MASQERHAEEQGTERNGGETHAGGKEKESDLGIWDHRYQFCGVEVFIHEDLDAGLGGTLFDGSLCLCNYIEYLYGTCGTDLFRGKKVIELGAGCGLPGLLLAALGAHVELTDIEETVQLLQENIENNPFKNVKNPGTVTARTLDWTDPNHRNDFHGPYDIVLAADTVYQKSVVEAFVATMKQICTENTKVFFAHPAARVAEASEYFWEIVHSHFKVERIDPSCFAPRSTGFQSPQKGVFILTAL